MLAARNLVKVRVTVGFLRRFRWRESLLRGWDRLQRRAPARAWWLWLLILLGSAPASLSLSYEGVWVHS